MGASDASSSSSIDSGSERFSAAALCGLASFVTNSREVLKIDWKLTPTEAAVVCSLLAQTEISSLAVQEDLPPGAGTRLGEALLDSKIIALTLEYYCEDCIRPTSELLRMLAANASKAAIEELSIHHLQMPDGRRCNLFGEFTALRRLSVSTDDTSRCCTPLLIEGISKQRALESLCIRGIKFSDSDAEALVAALKPLPLMTDLTVSNADLGAKTARPIGDLVARGRIKKLNLCGNRLEDEGASAMVNAILRSPRGIRCNLRELNLRGCGIGQAGGRKVVAELVAGSPRLTKLDLSENCIGETSRPLNARSLEELDLVGCQLGPRGVESLLGKATRLPALKALRMGWNGAGDMGIRAIGRLLLRSGSGHIALRELLVGHNDITEAGALELAGVLSRIYTLESIDLGENQIGARGATAILRVLAAMSASPMDTIRFRECEIGDVGAAAVALVISRRGCRFVLLSDNGISAAGAKAISDSVRECSATMSVLDLSCNPIGDVGVSYLLDGILASWQQNSQNRRVRELNIARTRMGVKGAMAAKRVVEAHDAIGLLWVSKHSGDEKADRIMEGVETWECGSTKSARRTAAVLEFL